MFVPAERFVEYFQGVGLDPRAVASAIGAKNFQEAVAAGSDIVIPTADFAVHVATGDRRIGAPAMTAEELASVTLEHLRHIRARVDQIADDVTDLKLRMSGIENALLLVKREVAHGDETDIRQQITLDKLAARVERIERRLELSDPPH